MAPIRDDEEMHCFNHHSHYRNERLVARARAGRATKLSKAATQLRKAKAHQEVLDILAKTRFHDKVKAILDEALSNK